MITVKSIKKADTVIIAVIIAVAAALFFALPHFRQAGKTVVISKNNKVVASLPLNENKTVNLDGNTIIIKNSTVKMADANCPKAICKHHNAISRKGEQIICLPHRVIVEVK